MKQFYKHLILSLVLLVSLSTGATAEEGNACAVEIHVLKAAAGAHPHIVEAADFRRRIAAGELQVLESYSANGVVNADMGFLIGGKVPVTYFDPRAGANQVQYFDSGLKLFLLVAPAGDRLRIDTSVDRMAVVDNSALYPLQDGLLARSTLLLKSGQTGVVMSTRGRLTAQVLKRSYPSVNFTENDVILIALTVRKR